MALSLSRCNRLTSPVILAGQTMLLTDANMTIDADTEKLAYKYFPATTSPITDIDVYLTPTGTITGVNFQIQVETNSSDTPSGTVLGSATPAFAGPAAGGFIGLKTLTVNTGNLTINQPVWVSLFRSSGASLDASNYIRMARLYGYPIFSMNEKVRHYNGTNWTTTSATNYPIFLIIKHADETHVGLPIKSSSTAPTNAINIYGTNRQGLKMKFGSKVILRGIQTIISKSGTPNTLEIEVYENSTLKYSGTVPEANILSGAACPMFFTSPILLASNTDIYIVLSQTGDGGSSSNYYRVSVYDIVSAYIETIYSPDTRFIYGTGDNPTTHTIETTEVAIFTPIFDDPAIDLDEGAGGNSNLWGMIR